MPRQKTTKGTAGLTVVDAPATVEPTTTDAPQTETVEIKPVNPALAKLLERAQVQAAQAPAGKKAKPQKECACGCGKLTKSIWFAGHNSKAFSKALQEYRAGQKVATEPVPPADSTETITRVQ